MQENHRLYLFFAVFFFAWTLRVVFLLPVDYRIEEPVAQFVWGQAWRVLIWVLPMLLYIGRYETANIVAFLHLNQFPRGRALAEALAVSLGYLLITGLEGWARGNENPAQFLELGAAMLLTRLLLTSITPLAEEALFRGFLQPLLQRRHRFWTANLMQAFLFVAIHWPGWLFIRGLDLSVLHDTVGVFIIGLVLGWLRERSQSLWPPILLHTLNNFWRGVAGTQ